MIEIEINNLTDFSIKEEFLKKEVIIFFKKENERLFNLFHNNYFFLSVVAVGPKRMRNFNKKYRNKNKITDVLSFSALDSNQFISPINNLGEVIICPKYIKKMIKRKENNKIDFIDRFLKILIHGILHLLKYNHTEMGEKGYL